MYLIVKSLYPFRLQIERDKASLVIPSRSDSSPTDW